MSDPRKFAAELLAFLKSIETVFALGDLDEALTTKQNRLDFLRKQEGEIQGLHAERLENGKVEAAALVKAADEAIAEKHRQADRAIERARTQLGAEVDAVHQQRARLDEEIAALGKQASGLRASVVVARQELASVNDAVSVARAAHDEVKQKIAELKQAL